METERIALSQRERDRLRVLHEVEQGHLAQIEAARRMKLTDRQVRRLLRGLAGSAAIAWCSMVFGGGRRIASWRDASSNELWPASANVMRTLGRTWPGNT